MFRFNTRPWLLRAATGSALAAAALFLAVQVATAGGPPYGIPSGVMPWEYHKYQGLKQRPRGYRPSPAKPATVTRTPTKSMVRVTALPHRHTADNPNVVVMVAHVPEDAFIWFEDAPTRQTGTLRWYESPPLEPGHNYSYTIRIVWYEDGEWVSQVHKYPVKAGDIRCIDIIPSDAEAVEREVVANLTKLEPGDRKAAEAQRFCAVQEGVRLGAMGVPVKVTLKGETVFLCCGACVKKAQGDPDHTLEKARKGRKKGAAPRSP
jgi:uncharacterized protein (TIGR03000 family)